MLNTVLDTGDSAMKKTETKKIPASTECMSYGGEREVHTIKYNIYAG